MTSPELSISEAGRKLLSTKIEPMALDLLEQRLPMTRFGCFLVKRRAKEKYEFLEEPDARWRAYRETLYITAGKTDVRCMYTKSSTVTVMLEADSLEEICTVVLFGPAGLKEAQDRVDSLCLEYHHDQKGAHNED